MVQMDLRLLFTGLSFLFLITSCGHRAERKPDLKSFNLEGLIDSQVVFLTNNKYQLNKKSDLGTSTESTQYIPDSAGWVRELSIIRAADISKPGLRSYYTLESFDSVGYDIDHYILLDPGNSNTIFQKIYHDRASGQILKIQALQVVSNPIYDSKRYIKITFKEGERDKPVIDSLLVSGFQAMIFSDTTFYRSISKILP